MWKGSEDWRYSLSYLSHFATTVYVDLHLKVWLCTVCNVFIILFIVLRYCARIDVAFDNSASDSSRWFEKQTTTTAHATCSHFHKFKSWLHTYAGVAKCVIDRAILNDIVILLILHSYFRHLCHHSHHQHHLFPPSVFTVAVLLLSSNLVPLHSPNILHTHTKSHTLTQTCVHQIWLYFNILFWHTKNILDLFLSLSCLVQCTYL